MSESSATRAPSLRLLPMGDAALLLETDDIDAVLAVAAVLAPLAEAGDGVWADVDDLVPAARTLLVVARPTTDLDELGRAVVARGPRCRARGRLRRAARRRDRRPLRRPRPRGGRPADRARPGRGRRRPHGHARGGWVSAASPRASPTSSAATPGSWSPAAPSRARVSRPDPSVSQASSAASIRASRPAGGSSSARTDVVLWDADRQPPALLIPGTTVRFVEADR